MGPSFALPLRRTHQWPAQRTQQQLQQLQGRHGLLRRKIQLTQRLGIPGMTAPHTCCRVPRCPSNATVSRVRS